MEKSSFFNSVAGDRKYNASDFSDFFSSLLTNGVFPNPSTNLQVIANNMTITIKVGKAWINGYLYYNTGDLTLPISVASGTLNRIDRIVIQFSTTGRTIKAVVKKGTNATTPVAPVLQRDADIFELGIADVYVGKGVTSILSSNLTDIRMNTAVCGWVNSLIQADTSAIFDQYQSWYNMKSADYNSQMTTSISTFNNLFNTAYNNYDSDLASDVASFNAQFNAEHATYNSQLTSDISSFNDRFNTWFAGVQNALAGDVAGNLLNKIDAVPMVYRGTVTPTSPKAIDFWFKEI